MGLSPPLGSPSMPPISMRDTWMPTPVRNPTSTVRDKKSARKPSPIKRARMRNPAAMRASRPHRAIYSDEPEAARPMRPAARMAAVAESAPTTRCRDEPKRANRAMGIKMA